MTDRERLLEQVKSAESDAEALSVAAFSAHEEVESAMFRRRAEHYGLTALALRRAIEILDHMPVPDSYLVNEAARVRGLMRNI